MCNILLGTLSPAFHASGLGPGERSLHSRCSARAHGRPCSTPPPVEIHGQDSGLDRAEPRAGRVAAHDLADSMNSFVFTRLCSHCSVYLLTSIRLWDWQVQTRICDTANGDGVDQSSCTISARVFRRRNPSKYQIYRRRSEYAAGGSYDEEINFDDALGDNVIDNLESLAFAFFRC